MKLFNRLLNLIPARACGHEKEIADLQETIAAVEHQLALADIPVHPGASLADRVEWLRVLHNGSSAEIERAADRERELAESLEEATTAIAVLQQRVKELGGDQLKLVPDVESAPEPAAGEEGEDVVTDTRLELGFRIIGIFFDDGPGRRHHWHLERGAERVKVPIVDREWLEKVASREVLFGAGDMLLADFHVITWRARVDGAVRVEYRAVEKVNRIIPPDAQIRIALVEETEVAHA